ncbi:MAG: hypothetical protein H7Y09_01835 [Chitinophagaceae bacterium]|nr:hypothetical protein [Anaerolineae bacterium]
MTKRTRNTISPAAESIERAKKEIAGETVEKSPTPKAAAAPVARSTKTTSERRADRRTGSSSARRAPGAPIQYSQNSKKDSLSSERIERLLANPTKVVTEAELRKEYGHVVNDLRNMFGLALALMVVLVILAQFI